MIEQMTIEIHKMKKVLQDQNVRNELLQSELAFLHTQSLQAGSDQPTDLSQISPEETTRTYLVRMQVNCSFAESLLV